MKKLILALGLCFSLGGALSAQEGAPSVVPAATSLADVKFEKTEHDFGTIKQGGPSDAEFKYVNTGKEPLVLTNCQASCGCTTPNCSKEPLMPGKSATIKVHYDSNRVGPFTKTITITSNAKSGAVMLTIKGNVEAAPAPAPAPGK